MDAAHAFRHGLATAAIRHNQPFNNHRRFPQQHHQHQQQQQQQHQALGYRQYQPDSPDDGSDREGPSRVAHTLTACCRCRQRKTRCDPTLPRCVPCERSGATCEYLDAAKGRKINRQYVVKLQERVRALEAELAQYTDEAQDYPHTNEDIVRPGGLVRLNPTDDTPRYLGPSSGVAMTRLLMEQAKRFTDSKHISELVPEVRARRQARMQSVQMTGMSNGRRKSYPMLSDGPAESLPTRATADKLVEMFNRNAQLFWPVLHQKEFAEDLEAVYNGDTDAYRNFIVRMVFAISLQKLGVQYAGLADSYYLAAMRNVEDVVRPKDLRTLQCLVTIGQYSLLTPTRTPVYYVIGLATRICQQEGLTDEKTMATGFDINHRVIDMRRRLLWIVDAMELGLAHTMGRPSGFAKGSDEMDVEFFAAVDDEYITPSGIAGAPLSESKLVAIHFYKMRLCQADIRRALYETKRPQPQNESHPWYEQTEAKLQAWLDGSPESPEWCKPWFTGRYHQMKVFMYRPSPQVPQPSARAAAICFDSSAYIINISRKQLEKSSVDVTWVFLLTLTMSLNTILWATSYPEVRHSHSREEVEGLVNGAIDVIDQCAERWPGTAPASQLYAVLSKACLRSYEAHETPEPRALAAYQSPVTSSTHSPPPQQQQQQQGNYHVIQPTDASQQLSYLNPPIFNQVFDSPPEAMNTFNFDPNFPPPQPSFRSNSIFANPATDSNGRRFSYFPPDFMQLSDAAPDDPTPLDAPNPLEASPHQSMATPPNQITNQLPTPPDSLATGVLPPGANVNLSPSALQAPGVGLPEIQVPPVAMHDQMHAHHPGNPKLVEIPQQTPRTADFAVQPTGQPSIQQRPLPQSADSSEWLQTVPPFVSPYSFGSMNNNLFVDPLTGSSSAGFLDPNSGLRLQGSAMGIGGNGDPNLPFNYYQGRQGSLSQSQQLELMNVLETEGLNDIDAILNASSTRNSDLRLM